MLDQALTALLRDGRNLLAFSGGVDSTALFHLLDDARIPFDIAIVHYHRRPEADAEVAGAAALATRHGKRCHIADAFLTDGNFEAEARRFRYDFFESLIRTHGYTALLTAHQLDDRLEWAVMQLARGAGTVEIAGMRAVTPREGYTLIRPLLARTKDELRTYLESRSLPFFTDGSNTDPRHARNAVRMLTAPLLTDHADGIRRSFALLDADARQLMPDSPRCDLGRTTLLGATSLADAMRSVDRVLKERGYLLSYAQKQELLRTGGGVVGGQWAIAAMEDAIAVAPYIRTPIPKTVRDGYRRAGAAARLRGALFSDGVSARQFRDARTKILQMRGALSDSTPLSTQEAE